MKSKPMPISPVLSPGRAPNRSTRCGTAFVTTKTVSLVLDYMPMGVPLRVDVSGHEGELPFGEGDEINLVHAQSYEADGEERTKWSCCGRAKLLPGDELEVDIWMAPTVLEGDEWGTQMKFFALQARGAEAESVLGRSTETNAGSPIRATR